MSLVDEVFAEEDRRLGKAKAAPAAQAARPQPTRSAPSTRVKRPETYSTAQSFIYGAADTVTFGYLDEAGAVADMVTKGGSYTENRDRNREALAEMARQNPKSFFAGQIGGAFIGPGAALGAGVKSVRGLALAGAAQGAVYGSGSSEADTAGGVVKDSIEGGAIGAVGGVVAGKVVIPLASKGIKQVTKYGVPLAARLRSRGTAEIEHGATVALPKKSKAPPKTPEVEPAPTPTVAKPVAEPNTPKVAPKEPETALPAKPAEGAITTAEELAAGTATKEARVRLNKMTQAEAAKLAERVDAAEKAGTVVDDPHYRSMLDVGLSDEPVTMEQAVRAVTEFENLTEQVRAKAVTGPATQQAATQDLAQQLKAVELGKLADDAIERTSRGMVDARLGQHLMTLAGVRFTKARDAYLDLVRKGDADAKLKMTDTIIEAMDWFTKGATIRSNQGRALNTRGSKTELMLDDLPDNVVENNIATARERIEEALNELGDEGVTNLLTRLRSLDDLDGLVEVFNDPAYAKQFTTFQKTRNSLGSFLRSNSFTVATGTINATSAVLHDWFRNNAARSFAAWSATRMGRLDEAAALRLEKEVGDAVYAQAHRQGLDAFIGRIKWEFWNDVEKVASVGWGSGKVAKTAASKRASAAAPKINRENLDEPRLSFTAEQVDAKVAALGDSSFANIAAHAIRAGAVAVNTVDALGTAMGKVMIGAVDDWADAWLRVKHTQVQNARFATREGIDLGLTGDELVEHAARRIQEINDLPPKEVLDRVEDALLSNVDLDPELQFLAKRDRLVQEEADRVQFIDGVQTAAGQASVKIAEGVDIIGGLGLVRNTIIPFIRTPIRIFERGLASYTPWGHKTDEIAAILAEGGPEAAVVQAQMHVGSLGITAGAALGASGILSLTNGAWDSTQGLDAAAPNSLRIGDKFVEIGRLDPFALTLALGGLIGQTLREGFKEGTEYDAYEGVRAAMATALVNIPRDAFLGKSYLTGLKDLNEMLFSRNEDNLGDKVTKHVAGIMTRLVPMGGQSRQLNDTLHGSATEAVSLTDQMLRTIPGAAIHAPVRRDLLGDPVKGRTMGFAIGDESKTDGQEITAVKAELRRLEFTIPNLRKTDPDGFELDAKELDRLRELRGKTVMNENGETLQQALGGLFADPWYRELDKENRKDATMEVIRSFNAPAREMLMMENRSYAAKLTGSRAFKAYLKDGLNHMEAVNAAEADTRAEGLPDPKLRGFLDFMRHQ